MDEKQFAQAVSKYRDRLYRIAYQYCKNRFDAEDAVQNTFVKLFGINKEFESEEHIFNWLIRVTINECKKQFISPWKKRTVCIEDEAENISAVFENPEESDLFTAVNNLPQKLRITVHLYYYEDFSVREISSILNTGESAVQMRLMRARKKLKENLQEMWQDE